MTLKTLSPFFLFHFSHFILILSFPHIYLSFTHIYLSCHDRSTCRVTVCDDSEALACRSRLFRSSFVALQLADRWQCFNSPATLHPSTVGDASSSVQSATLHRRRFIGDALTSFALAMIRLPVAPATLRCSYTIDLNNSFPKPKPIFFFVRFLLHYFSESLAFISLTPTWF